MSSVVVVVWSSLDEQWLATTTTTNDHWGWHLCDDLSLPLTTSSLLLRSMYI